MTRLELFSFNLAISCKNRPLTILKKKRINHVCQQLNSLTKLKKEKKINDKLKRKNVVKI